MSLPHQYLTLPTDVIRITPWTDPVLDQLGHDARSTYVERFWLPILGPTTTLFMRRVAHELDSHPEGFDLPVLDTASALGLGVSGGRNTPFLRGMSRAAKFKLARLVGHDTLAVQAKLPPLTRVLIERLPAHIRDEHATWQDESRRAPDVEQYRRRARRLALSLIELGETDEQVEQQLHRWKVHPALAHDALRWAHERRRGAVAADTGRPVPTTSAGAPPAASVDGASDPEATLIRSSGAPPLSA